MNLPNRLIHEKSPYLLQHAHNPVQWFAWGEEAFARAREEDRPIFLSIGYSTCHWCHVMERESFEDEAIAALLNTHFVPIKVDREERPDVDRIYMTAVQAMGFGGGWPLSIFLTPELFPFYGGTYFPPISRYGRTGFPDVLRKLHELWVSERGKINESAEQITAFLRETPGSASQAKLPGPEVMDRCVELFRSTYDPAFGGFGGGPKFPRPAVLQFLLRHSWRKAEPSPMVETTLTRMASGGMYDHLGGGFHRYSVDGEWRVPHFEKMLYDQGQLAVVFLEAFQYTRNPAFASVARDVLAYVLRDMTSPLGGFYSAEDADSPLPDAPGESGEGAFYVWSRKEIFEALGTEAGELLCFTYGVTEEGNALSDPQQEFVGKNILYLPHNDYAICEQFGLPQDRLDSMLGSARKRLLERRSKRPRPIRDDKIITAWNGLMISAFALAARVFGEQAYEDAARRAVRCVEQYLVDPASGRLLRRYRDGEARFEGQLDDYTFFVQSLIDLYETTGEAGYLRSAVRLTEMQIDLFEDREGGGFFDTAGEESLLVRMKEHYDGAEPAANSVAARNLLRLARLLDRGEWSSIAERTIASGGKLLVSQPVALPLMVSVLDFALGAPQQIFIVGAASDPHTRALRQQVRTRFLPHAVIHLVEPGRAQEDLSRLIPFAETLSMRDGTPTAYVCRNLACTLPTTDPAVLASQLEERA